MFWNAPSNASKKGMWNWVALQKMYWSSTKRKIWTKMSFHWSKLLSSITTICGLLQSGMMTKVFMNSGMRAPDISKGLFGSTEPWNTNWLRIFAAKATSSISRINSLHAFVIGWKKIRLSPNRRITGKLKWSVIRVKILLSRWWKIFFPPNFAEAFVCLRIRTTKLCRCQGFCLKTGCRQGWFRIIADSACWNSMRSVFFFPGYIRWKIFFWSTMRYGTGRRRSCRPYFRTVINWKVVWV